MSNPTAPSSAPTFDGAAAVLDRDPLAAFHQRADALQRCAIECLRQHERYAQLVQQGAMATEQRAAQQLVQICDEALAELAASYERACARAHPGKDDACWHAANGLWMAAREYTRRHRTSVRAARGIGEDGEHSSTRLAEIALDYDLEASALLLLKQASDAYRRVRPDVR